MDLIVPRQVSDNSGSRKHVASFQAFLDLDYEEDVGADVDMNVVMTGSGGLIEVQGTAEGIPFTREQLERLLDLAAEGIDALVREQRAALEGP